MQTVAMIRVILPFLSCFGAFFRSRPVAGLSSAGRETTRQGGLGDG